MKTRKIALFAFWTLLATMLVTLPSWACDLSAMTGFSAIPARSNAVLLGVAFALVAVQQALTSRVAAVVAGWFGRLGTSR
jgi:hypothetical protein